MDKISPPYQPPQVSPARVAEFVGALQSGLPPWDYQHFLGGGCLAVCNPDELAGIINYLATDNAIEKQAVRIRENEIRGQAETIEILRRKLEAKTERNDTPNMNAFKQLFTVAVALAILSIIAAIAMAAFVATVYLWNLAMGILA